MRIEWIFGLLALGLLFTGCLKDDCTRTVTYMKYEPVYMTMDELRSSVEWGEKQPLEKPGKIYVYGHYLFVNEVRKGIHVYDNTNSAAPTKIGFLHIPGNMDMAVQNGYLYADNATDLISIDLNSGIDQAEVVDREKLAYQPIHQDTTNKILMYYEEKEVTEEVSCGASDDQWNTGWPITFAENFSLDQSAASSGNSGGNNTGQGGSMARFSLMKDHLYIIDDSDLHTFQTTNNGQIEYRTDISVSWGIETLFGYEDYLFIGANNGMHIMDNTNPENPTHLASYSHATACDPVFVSGDYAYVTLRDGRNCENFTNQLDVVSIDDIENPELVRSFEMDHPHGLSVSNEKLYLCEGEHGVKSFDAAIPEEVGNELLQQQDGVHAFDVIVNTERNMIITGDDGIYQFSIEPGTGTFEQISRIQTD